MIILWAIRSHWMWFLCRRNSLYDGDNYEMLIRIIQSLRNRNINIIMDNCYNGKANVWWLKSNKKRKDNNIKIKWINAKVTVSQEASNRKRNHCMPKKGASWCQRETLSYRLLPPQLRQMHIFLLLAVSRERTCLSQT